MLDTTTLTQLKDILSHYIDPKDYTIFIFGSRATGKSQKYSDIDLGIEGEKPLNLRTIAHLQDAFEESNIPYTVDIVDFTTVSDKFKTIAKRKSISLN